MQAQSQQPISSLEAMNAHDTLHKNLAHADALIATIVGEGFERFKNMNDEIQDNYLWALSEIIGSAVTAYGTVSRHDSERRESAQTL